MKNNLATTLIVLVVILAAGAAYGAYYSFALQERIRAQEEELAARAEDIERLKQNLANTEKANAGMLEILTKQQKDQLELEKEQRINEEEIEDLIKLTTIDPELLKKYSKVYFLSDNYIPEDLDNIRSKYRLDPSRTMEILSKVRPFLYEMMEAAEDDDIELRVASAYRSFGDQSQLKAGYVVQYGTGANAFSAEQGYSEHQLGTTVDLTTPQLGSLTQAFENTQAFQWLTRNAHNYGFVLSYPKGNQYYVYEPWHWRFVGEDLAEDLHDDGKNFYELDQREIDKYLIKIFD